MSEPSNDSPSLEGNTPPSVFDWAQRAQATDAVLDQLRALSLARRHRRRRLYAASCALGLACIAALALSRLGEVVPRAMPRFEAEVATAEPAIVRQHLPERQHLPDGSVVELREGAQVLVVEFSETLRRVVLRQGAAHFLVEPDPGRPFEVVADGVSVRAVGTAFCVDLSQVSVEVLVTEGRVAVSEITEREAQDLTLAHESVRAEEAVAEPLMLQAGERARVAPGTAEAPAVRPINAADWEARLAWRVPRLDFSQARLGELLPEFNRYAARRLVLADAELAELRVSGVLRADKVNALAEMLGKSFGLRIEDRGEGDIIIHRH